MGLRARLAEALGTGPGRAIFGVAAGLVICSPVFIWRGWGVAVVVVAIVAFFAGYQFARWEWRRRGYVPKWESVPAEEPVNAASRRNLPPS